MGNISIEWVNGIGRYGESHTSYLDRSPYDLSFSVTVLHGCAYFRGGCSVKDGTISMDVVDALKRCFEAKELDHVNSIQWERAREDGSLDIFRWKRRSDSRRGWVVDKSNRQPKDSNLEDNATKV